MLERNAFCIDKNKSSEFNIFLKENAKDKKFWEENKKMAKQKFDLNELRGLFVESKH